MNTPSIRQADKPPRSGGEIVVMWALRVAIGWLFLYEGLHKLVLSSGWTAGVFLRNARSSFFRAMADNAAVLSLVDILNVWGLVTRVAAFCGAGMLLLYTLAKLKQQGEAGLGTNRFDQIEKLGLSMRDAVFPVAEKSVGPAEGVG